MEKSANKRWKESGSTLSFKDWIDRENKKNESTESFLPFDAQQSVKDTISQTLDESKQGIQEAVGYKNTSKDSTFLGLDKGILAFSTILIVGSLGYYFYNRLKVKK